MSDETDRLDELSSYRRSFDAISSGYSRAALNMPDHGRGDEPLQRWQWTGFLAETMWADLLALELAMTFLAVAIARRSGETPRDVFERKFKNAPDDETWREVFPG